MSLMAVALAGSDELIASAGTLHGSRVFSHEQLVLDAELFAMVCHMLDGFTVTDDDLAVDVIEAAGPAGHFLVGTDTWDAWVEGGRPEPKDRAREKARELLATDQPEPLPEDVDAELRAIVAAREAEILAGD
jgi:trimethylamine--corrinoid protein Co-methyltransferase